VWFVAYEALHSAVRAGEPVKHACPFSRVGLNPGLGFVWSSGGGV
jgi:hypothetical protein